MLYYLLHEPTQLQIFNPDWNRPSIIFGDLDWVVDVFNIESIDDLVICGGKFRFRIEYAPDGCFMCVYEGKHFMTDASYGYSYIISQAATNPRRIHSNFQLSALFGRDINN